MTRHHGTYYFSSLLEPQSSGTVAMKGVIITAAMTSLRVSVESLCLLGFRSEWADVSETAFVPTTARFKI